MLYALAARRQGSSRKGVALPLNGTHCGTKFGRLCASLCLFLPFPVWFSERGYEDGATGLSHTSLWSQLMC